MAITDPSQAGDYVILENEVFDQSSETAEDDPTIDRFIGFVTVLAVVVYAITIGIRSMTESFRMDELLTGWIISDSFADSISRSQTHQGQSPLYFAGLWLWKAVFGASEFVLRIPSLFAHFATAWLINRLGTKLLNRRAGAIGALILLGMNVQAVQARPYSFMVLGVVVSAYFAVAWSEEPTTMRSLRWAVAAAFVLYMHPLGIWSVAPQAWFLVSGWRASAKTRQVVVFVCASVVLSLPLVPQVLSLRARQGTLVIVDLPSITDLIAAIFWLPVALALVVAAVAWVRTADTREPSSDPFPWFVVLWAIVPALALFAQSHLTGDSFFVNRYMAGALPGIGLAVGALLTRFKAAHYLKFSLLAFLVGLLLTPQAVPAPDYGPAITVIDESPDALVLTMTAFIELANAEAFPPVGDTNEYFNGPLRWYGVTEPLVSIPRDDSEMDLRNIEASVEPAISTNRPVVLIDFAWGDRRPGPLYAQQLLLDAGYAIDTIEQTNFVTAQRLVPR